MSTEPSLSMLGVDKISIRKGHNNRIVVSSLDRRRPIWDGDEGWRPGDSNHFFAAMGWRWLGVRASAGGGWSGVIAPLR
ncbi:MAG: hypothetical protein ABI988_17865, partial [Nitrospirota bacterium]